MNSSRFPVEVQACGFTLKVKMKLFLPMYLTEVVSQNALQKTVI